MLKIILVGGGTAGHIYPLLTVAQELRKVKRGKIELLFLGPGTELEKRLIIEGGWSFEEVPAGKIRRYFALENIFDLFKTGEGIIKATSILKKEKPDAIFSKGGFAGYPVVLAARHCKVPVIVHESDIVVGAANLKALPQAVKFLTGYPTACYPKEVKRKAEYVGVPVRSGFEPVGERKIAELRQKHQLIADRPVLLIFGGSQGALAINELVWKILPAILEVAQIIHITGPDWLGSAQGIKHELSAEQKILYHIKDYVDDLAELVLLADVILCRAGATTLAELAVAEKPAIVIPLPSAASDHQRKNAQYYADREAVVMLEQEGLTAGVLLDKIKQILLHKDIREKLSHNMAKLKVQDSAEKIARIILEEIGK